MVIQSKKNYHKNQKIYSKNVIIKKVINYKKLYLKGGNNSEYELSDYRSLKEFFKAIYYTKITIEEAEAIQEEFDVVIGELKVYKPKKCSK